MWWLWNKLFKFTSHSYCNTGGLISHKHNDLGDLIGEFCFKSRGNVFKEPNKWWWSLLTKGFNYKWYMGLSEGALFYECVLVYSCYSHWCSLEHIPTCNVSFSERKRRRKSKGPIRLRTKTPLVVSVDGVFAPQMNSFFSVLIDR